MSANVRFWVKANPAADQRRNQGAPVLLRQPNGGLYFFPVPASKDPTARATEIHRAVAAPKSQGAKCKHSASVALHPGEAGERRGAAKRRADLAVRLHESVGTIALWVQS